MSFKVVILGLIGMFSTFILFAMSPTMMALVPGDIYVYVMTGIGIFISLMLTVFAIMLNGVMGPFLSAKTSGNVLIGSLTSTGNLRLLAGREKGGMLDTKDGSFITPPKSVFSWPNGVKGGIAYYKYGSTIPPKLMKAASVMKEKLRIKNIEEYMARVKAARKENKEFVVRLD